MRPSWAGAPVALAAGGPEERLLPAHGVAGADGRASHAGRAPCHGGGPATGARAVCGALRR